jgi:hypothetical protein
MVRAIFGLKTGRSPTLLSEQMPSSASRPGRYCRDLVLNELMLPPDQVAEGYRATNAWRSRHCFVR